jgi:hypothetical protein
MTFAGLEDNRFVERVPAVTVGFADEDAQQDGIAGEVHLRSLSFG